MNRIPPEYFQRYTPSVARDLIGCVLVRIQGGRRISGVIVETEAYRGTRDPASHAHRGMTPRNEVMFGPPGRAYVFFTMGIHYCLNITTEPMGSPGAILIRAAEPREGLDLMRRNRGAADIYRLAAGPGNLTRAFRIDGDFNGEDLFRSKRLFVERGGSLDVGASSRVGVARGKARQWRFYAIGNPFVSKGKPS